MKSRTLFLTAFVACLLFGQGLDSQSISWQTAVLGWPSAPSPVPSGAYLAVAGPGSSYYKMPVPTSGIQGASVANVLNFGADPTGVNDSAPAINAAAASVGGIAPDVYMPAGTYLVKSPITLNSQCLYGDGLVNTTITINSTFSASAAGVILLNGETCVHDLAFMMLQPTAPAAQLANTTIAAGALSGIIASGTPANGNLLYDVAGGSASGVPNGATLSNVVISGSVITATVTPAVTVLSESMTTAAGRANYAALGTCDGITIGCKYPPAILSVTARRFHLWNLQFNSTWISVANSAGNSMGGCFMHDIQDGALNIGLDLFSIRDVCHVVAYEHHSGYGDTSGPLKALYVDGNTISTIIGQTGNVGGISGEVDGFDCTDCLMYVARTQINNPNSWAQFENGGFDTGATIEVTGAQWVKLTSLYFSPGGMGQNTNCQVNATGGTIDLYNVKMATNGSPQNGHVAESAICGNSNTASMNVFVSGGETVLNTASVPAVTVSGPHTAVRINDHYYDAGALGSTAWTTPVVQIGTNTTVTFVDNLITAAPSAGNVGLLTVSTDLSANVVNGNNWNGWSWAPPGNTGFYGYNSDALNLARSLPLQWTQTTGTAEQSIVADTSGDVTISPSSGGTAIFNKGVSPPQLPVASLPVAPPTGTIALVTNATAACSVGTTPTGGGTNKCLVEWNGTAWVEFGI